MYKIIGGDQKPYGPVPAGTLRQWFAEGRVNGQTQVQAEGAQDWQPLETVAEFSDMFAPAVQYAQADSGPTGASGEPSDSGYELDVAGCVGRGWELLKRNFGLMVGATLLFVLGQVVLMLLAQNRSIGWLVSLASIVIAGPLAGGLYYFLLRLIRNEDAGIGDIFAGFQRQCGQLILTYFVMMLLTFLVLIPGGVMLGVPFAMIVAGKQLVAWMIMLIIAGALLVIVPMTYLSVAWSYAFPLVIDKGMDFWPALTHSRRMVTKQWWSVFGLILLAGLINLAGLLLCGVGLLASYPLGMAALAYGYERIFNGGNSTTPAS